MDRSTKPVFSYSLPSDEKIGMVAEEMTNNPE